MRQVLHGVKPTMSRGEGCLDSMGTTWFGETDGVLTKKRQHVLRGEQLAGLGVKRTQRGEMANDKSCRGSPRDVQGDIRAHGCKEDAGDLDDHGGLISPKIADPRTPSPRIAEDHTSVDIGTHSTS